MPHMAWTLTLVSLDTPDGGTVDVALSPPDLPAPRTALIHLHGKGSNFYGVPGRLLAPTWVVPDLVHLAVNMRCHDLGYTRTDITSPDFTAGLVPVAGGWWEDLAAGIDDVTAAVAYARGLGCRRIFLVGHSSGGFYATQYAARVGDVAGLILLSPLTSNKTALPVWFPDEAQLDLALEQAREAVSAGRGHEIIPLPRWYYGISAASLLQRAAEPDGVWAADLAAADCPVLMVIGGAESRAALWRDEMGRARHPDSRTVELDGADHHYVGFEEQVRSEVAAFVTRHAPELAWTPPAT